MIELHGCGILEDVTPPEIRAVGGLAIIGVEQLIGWRCDASAHERELVVQKTGIEASNESTCQEIRWMVIDTLWLGFEPNFHTSEKHMY